MGWKWEGIMQTDIEQFLNILETERGFSVNTIFAACGDGITHTNKNPRINDSRH